MDSRIPTVSRADVVLVESAPRPTPRPPRVSFREVLAAGANTLVQGAEIALSKLPGSPVTAAAVRGGGSTTPMTTMSAIAPASGNAVAEGPGATGAAGSGVSLNLGALGAAGGTGLGVNAGVPGATDASGGGIEAAMQQNAELSLYYLQIQQREDAQNRTFTAMSNILKTEHDSAKAAINNIHS
jgi:hypothetical protein